MSDKSISWAPDWLAQLEQEEKAVAAALASVRHVGDALAVNDLPALTAAVAAQAEVIASVNNVRACSLALRERFFAKSESDPRAFSPAKSAKHIWPDLHLQVADRVRRLRELATLVERQNRCNAYVANQSLRFVRRLLGILVGARDGGERYSAAGVPQQNAAGSILNARG